MPAALHVVESGDRAAPVVVFVHGAMDRSSSFGRVARVLADLHVVRYDRRGYARSIDVGVGDLDDHVDDLREVLGGLAEHRARSEASELDDPRPVVFGHSFGGVVAVTAAARDPDAFGAVVAYESPALWEPWWPTRSGPTADAGADAAEEAEAFMRRAIGDRIWERLPARSRADRRAEGGALRADLASLRGQAPFRPSDVRVPVVASYGSETTWWHRRASEELAADVPIGELVVVGGASHGVHLSHPTATGSLVRRALELVGPVSPSQR